MPISFFSRKPWVLYRSATQTTASGPTQLLLLGCVLVRQKGILATQELKWQRDWRGLAWQADWEEATGVGWGGWERSGAASEEDEREQPGGRRRGGGAGRRGPAPCSADARALGERRPWPLASGRGAENWGLCHSADSLAGSATRPLPGQVQVGGDAWRASGAWVAVSRGRRATDIGQRPRGECAAPRRPGSWTPRTLAWPRGSPRSCPRGTSSADRVGEGSATATEAVP